MGKTMMNQKMEWGPLRTIGDPTFRQTLQMSLRLSKRCTSHRTWPNSYCDVKACQGIAPCVSPTLKLTKRHFDFGSPQKLREDENLQSLGAKRLQTSNKTRKHSDILSKTTSLAATLPPAARVCAAAFLAPGFRALSSFSGDTKVQILGPKHHKWLMFEKEKIKHKRQRWNQPKWIKMMCNQQKLGFDQQKRWGDQQKSEDLTWSSVSKCGPNLLGPENENRLLILGSKLSIVGYRPTDHNQFWSMFRSGKGQNLVSAAAAHGLGVIPTEVSITPLLMVGW